METQSESVLKTRCDDEVYRWHIKVEARVDVINAARERGSLPDRQERIEYQLKQVCEEVTKAARARLAEIEKQSPVTPST